MRWLDGQKLVALISGDFNTGHETTENHMSWRDGMNFAAMWKRVFPDVKFDTDSVEHRKIEDVYCSGYRDGWIACDDHDPQWDTD